MDAFAGEVFRFATALGWRSPTGKEVYAEVTCVLWRGWRFVANARLMPR